ncbi:5633_t:CDS:2, partial [Racocetra fulgida]
KPSKRLFILEDFKDNDIVEDGGSVMALENKVAQESDQGLNKSQTKEFKHDIELEDDPPKKRKTGKGKNAQPNNDDEATIKELKAFIVKCGVPDCDTISSQIDRLNKILRDLGIKDFQNNDSYVFIIGRPTLEKCKKVRERRELEAELNSMDVGNIISDDIKEGRKARASRGIFNPTGRRIIRVKRQIEEETDDDASDRGSE